MGYESFTSSALSPGGFVYFDEACIVFNVNILDETLNIAKSSETPLVSQSHVVCHNLHPKILPALPKPWETLSSAHFLPGRDHPNTYCHRFFSPPPSLPPPLPTGSQSQRPPRYYPLC
ncbi:hypothetical protein ACTXT7_014503 [Hymenolepis weldensis]